MDKVETIRKRASTSTLDGRMRAAPEKTENRMNLPQPKPRVVTPKLVKNCYTLMHAIEALGIVDLSDGEYLPNDKTLEEGIERQLNYLLDQVGCNRPGFRLLEIGCGYGSLLREAKKRGARAVGVNISPDQVNYINDNGLEAYCCNYRDLLEETEWHGQFDGVIANGSLEHWVQPEDVLAGRMNDIYNESFAIAHKALDPNVPDARYVTTALHMKRGLTPEDYLAKWYRYPRGSDPRHMSLIHHSWGGWYPVDKQLEECAKPYFSLEKEMDGTEGYRIASEYRLARGLRGLYTNPKYVWRLVNSFVHRPQHTATALIAYFIEKSWDWQFLGEDPPTKLLRHTWKRNSLAKK